MIQVTKAQAEMIEKVLNRYGGDKTKAAVNYVPRQGFTLEMFVRCMIEGYETVQTKEEQLLHFYNCYKGKQGPTRYAIRMALRILDIHVEGITDDNGEQD